MEIKEIDKNIGNPICINTRLDGENTFLIIITKRERSNVFFAYTGELSGIGIGMMHRTDFWRV